MAGLLDELKETLKEEYEYYKKLLNFGNEKTELIVANNVEKLNEINLKEQVVVSAYTNLSKKREKIVEDICIVLNIDKDKMTIKLLVDKLPENEQKELMEIAENLKDIVEEVRTVGEQNKILIQNSLEYVEFTLNLMKASTEKTQVTQYHKKGSISYGNYGNNANFFDTVQ